MFATVPTTPRTLENYRSIVGDKVIDEIRALAAPLRGARVLHLSECAFGTGQAELLNSVVPLLDDACLAIDWQVTRISEEFAHVSHAINSALSGFFVQWTPQLEDTWLAYNTMNARIFDQEFDFVFVHDPQLASLLACITDQTGKRPGGKWLWHCHLDMADAQPDVWDLIRRYVIGYDHVVFAAYEHTRANAGLHRVAIIPPAIDPLAPKNVEVPAVTLREGLLRYDVDPERPMICQISRFDEVNDPLGVIDAYELARREVPGLQLVLVASMIAETAEGGSYFEQCARRVGEDHDIHLLSQLNGVGNTESNIFQRAAKVVVQKSIKKGFGLGIAEALWKGRPVVAGRVPGFPLQVEDGVDGYLVDNSQECAERIVFLLKHPLIAAQMGQAGKEHVRQRFLITRYLKDYLELLKSL